MIMELLAELRTLIARHAGGEAARQALPDIVLASFNEPTQPHSYVGDPIFGLVAQGAKRAVLGDLVFDYAAGKYLIVGIELPMVANIVQASVEEPCLGLGLPLKPFAVASLLLESGAGGDRRRPVGHCGERRRPRPARSHRLTSAAAGPAGRHAGAWPRRRAGNPVAAHQG
jgi:AraC-type transcriptional regulator N-terminus